MHLQAAHPGPARLLRRQVRYVAGGVPRALRRLGPAEIRLDSASTLFNSRVLAVVEFGRVWAFEGTIERVSGKALRDARSSALEPSPKSESRYLETVPFRVDSQKRTYRYRVLDVRRVLPVSNFNAEYETNSRFFCTVGRCKNADALALFDRLLLVPETRSFIPRTRVGEN